MREDLQLLEEISEITVLDDAVQQLRRIALLYGYGHLVVHLVREDKILNDLKALSDLRKICVYVSDLELDSGDSWYIENGRKVHRATWDDFDNAYNEVKDVMQVHPEKYGDIMRTLGLLGGTEVMTDKGFVRYAFKVQSNMADFIYVLIALGKISSFSTSYDKHNDLYLIDCYTEF